MTWVYCDPKSRTAMVCGMCWLWRGDEDRRNGDNRKLESQPCILVPASRALAQPRSLRRGVEPVAADAVEGRLAPLQVETHMVAPIIEQPEDEDGRGD